MGRDLIMLLLQRDDWRALETMDNWLFIFDRMPKKMRLVVDFKIQGYGNREIALLCDCSVNNIEKQLQRAKKRFLRGENVL